MLHFIPRDLRSLANFANAMHPSCGCRCVEFLKSRKREKERGGEKGKRRDQNTRLEYVYTPHRKILVCEYQCDTTREGKRRIGDIDLSSDKSSLQRVSAAAVEEKREMKICTVPAI